MSPGLIVLLLSLLLGIQPIATDLYLPALPAITQHFGTVVQQAQLTLTVMMLSFGISQLVWGPVSDRFGRRPVLLAGMAMFALAGLMSALSQSMESLILWRAVQGVAIGAAVMCARAVVRDLYSPAEGARAMSKGLTGLGIIACASAPLGGLISEWLGWRAALSCLAIFGAGTLLILALRFEETLVTKNHQALQPISMFKTWKQIVRHPTFWAFTLLSTTSYLGLFTFLAASPFVFIGVLGLSKAGYGLVMLAMSLSYITGTFGCRRLLPRLGVRRSVRLAAAFTLAGGTLMGCLAWAGYIGVWAIMLPLVPFMLAHGVHQPCGQSGAVAPFPQAAGAASALSGFVSMVSAFVLGGWIGQSLAAGGQAALLTLTNTMWFWSILISLVGWTLVQWHGEAHTPPTRVQPAPSSKQT